MKFSIISVVYNNVDNIADCLASVQSQTDVQVEHVIIDGNSTDGTKELISEKCRDNDVFLSEPDAGIYDALNKGFERATGDIIGILHSDDQFHHEQILSKVKQTFNQTNCSVVYGNLLMGNFDKQKNVFHTRRVFKSGKYENNLSSGWMPAHPALFTKNDVWKEIGPFDTNLRISSDYDWMLRLFATKTISKCYLNDIITRMSLGGVSTSGFMSELAKFSEDYHVIKRHNLPVIPTLIGKKTRKLFQYRKWVLNK